MLANYLRIALRNLLRNRTYSLINIFGLAIGVASCILIFLYLRYELTWNRYLEGVENIYRVNTCTVPVGEDPEYKTTVTSLLAPEVEKSISGVKSVTRLSESLEETFRIGTDIFETSSICADPNFFATFNIPLLSGDPDEALYSLDNVVVSERFANEYFPGRSPLGEVIELNIADEFKPFTIAGIAPTPPKNASLDYDIIYPYENTYAFIRNILQDTWGMSWSWMFLRLEENADAAPVEAAITELTRSLGVQEDGGEDLSYWHLQPLRDIHIALNNPRDMPTDVEPTGAIVLSVIALLILLIAFINFTTLSLGRSTTRSMEVGMRKVLGATRTPLMAQFWMETGVMALLAILLGLLLTELALPEFNRLANRSLELAFTPGLILTAAALWVLLVFAAGSYPALVLSGFKPARAFRGETKVGGRGALRRVLVFIQFALSICLIAVTFVMARQLSYISRKQLGFNGKQVVEIAAFNQDDSGAKLMRQLRDELAGEPDILAVSGAANSLSSPWFRANWRDPEGNEWGPFRLNVVDPSFLPFFEIPLLAGRNFKPDSEHERLHAAIINESAAEHFGFEDPVGQYLPGEFEPIEVVGLMPDYHISSLREEIPPSLLVLSISAFFTNDAGMGLSANNWFTIQRIFVRIAPDNIPRTLAKLEETWKTLAPEIPFDYSFVDESVDRMYHEDRRWSQIVTWASVLAVAIAALGLFGLSTLEVEQRRKEIGIRKVLGASIANVILLLTRQISLLVAGAMLVAGPVAWMLASRWLEDFAYRINLNPVWMIAAGLAALAVAWFTVGGLAWRAASSNPVDAIRYE